MSFIVMEIYCPPSSDVGFYDNFRAVLKELNHWGKEVIVSGDFSVNWADRKSSRKLLTSTE